MNKNIPQSCARVNTTFFVFFKEFHQEEWFLRVLPGYGETGWAWTG